MTRETILQQLRTIGTSLPDTDEGISCKGTILESRTVKVQGRAFLFLGKDVRLKLKKTVAAAKKLAAKKPDVYEVGSGGWTKIMLAGELPPIDLLEKWVHESYALVAGPAPKKKAPSKKKRSSAAAPPHRRRR
jgi:hypothetical protein